MINISDLMHISPSSRVEALRNSIQEQINAPILRPKFHMVRDARNLEMEAIRTENGTSLEIDLGNGLVHTFDQNSRVSKHLNDTPFEVLKQKLQTGGYFFMEVDNQPQLFDFVLNADNRFIHKDNDIQSIVNLLGVSEIPSGRYKHLHGTTQMRSHYMGKTYSTEPITLDNMNGDVQGGEYNSLLRFVWSPFSQHINTAFELMRLVCANGQVGLASFLNAKVPLVNMWEQNMDIASRQIQNMVQSKVSKRLEHMSKTPTSVGVVMKIQNHIEQRLKNPDIEETEQALLNGMMRVVDPTIHLGHVYKDRVFDDKNVAEQCASHLSKLSAYNLSTELSSHTSYSDTSTDNALQKIANALMWTDRDFKTSRNIPQPFSTADHAFFGMMS